VEDLEYPTHSPSSFTTADNSLYNEFGHYVFKDSNFEVMYGYISDVFAYFRYTH
jgi:hypothetical protein